MQISWDGRPSNCSKINMRFSIYSIDRVVYQVVYQVISIGHFEQQFFEFILVSDPFEKKSNQMEPRSPRYCYPRGICIWCDTIFHKKPPTKRQKNVVCRARGGRVPQNKKNIKSQKRCLVLVGRVLETYRDFHKNTKCVMSQGWVSPPSQPLPGQ